MPDITMCKNEECPLKDKCYRHEAKPSTMQSYFMDIKPNEKGECKYYWKLTN
jgi:hypothetical protein